MTVHAKIFNALKYLAGLNYVTTATSLGQPKYSRKGCAIVLVILVWYAVASGYQDHNIKEESVIINRFKLIIKILISFNFPLMVLYGCRAQWVLRVKLEQRLHRTRWMSMVFRSADHSQKYTKIAVWYTLGFLLSSALHSTVADSNGEATWQIMAKLSMDIYHRLLFSTMICEVVLYLKAIEDRLTAYLRTVQDLPVRPPRENLVKY